MTNLPVMDKPPGKAIKIAWYWRLYNWFMNKFVYRFPEITNFDATDMTAEQQETIKTMYNMSIDKTRLTVMPPITRKD